MDPTSPGVVTVTSGSSSVADIALVTLAPRQTVSGLVQDTAGRALQGIEVYADATDDGDDSDETVTDATGVYDLSLRPGTYELYVYDPDDDHDGSTRDITVGSTSLTVPTIALQNAGRWALSGRVVNAAGAAIDDTTVELYRVYDYGDGDFDYDYVDETEAGTDGAYRFDAVRGNRDYAVFAGAPGHIGGCSEARATGNT